MSKKELFSYENKKVVNYSGEVEVSKNDKTFMEIILRVNFVVICVAVALGLLKVVTLQVAVAIIAISMGICVVVPMIYLVIKYFVVQKAPLEKENYHITRKKNVFTGENSVEIKKEEKKK